MWEFRFYSRGGQGAVTAAKILTNAAIIEGKFAQAIPSYGQERKGAPIYTYGRISDEPIEVKSYVYRPNCVICFDTSLEDVGIDITEGIRPGCILVVNSPVPVYEDVFAKVCNIDADKLTHEILGEVPPNVAMLGALVKATGCVSIESLLQAIKIKIPGKAGEIMQKLVQQRMKMLEGMPRLIGPMSVKISDVPTGTWRYHVRSSATTTALSAASARNTARAALLKKSTTRWSLIIHTARAAVSAPPSARKRPSILCWKLTA